MVTWVGSLRWLGVSTLLAATVLATAPAPYAEAAPPAPTLLTPEANASTNLPVFSWDRVAGASKYEIWVDDDPSFASPTKQTTVNRSWVPTAPLAYGVQHWEVRAYGTDGTVSGWSEGQFEVGKLAGPALVSPADDPLGAHELVQPNDPPLLSWAPISGATKYTVEVDDDDLFLDPQTTDTRTTSMVVPDQKANGTYFWRVTATLDNGMLTLPSETWQYHISPLPEVQGAQELGSEEDVVLDWDPVPGAKSYNLWVSTDPDFNNTDATVLPPTTTVLSTRFSPKVTFANNDTYYWKVRAVNAGDETKDWSGVDRHEFSRRWTDKPVLLWPPNTLAPAASDPLYFQWTPVDHASYYQLQVGTDPNFSSGTFNTCTTASTTYTPGHLSSDACMPLSQGATYYWRVRAIDGPKGVEGIYDSTSNYHKFTYDPGRVELIAPADGDMQVDVPTLSWKHSPEAQTYTVTVKDKTGVTAASTTTFSLNWTPDKLLDPTKGPYTWGVIANDYNGAKSVAYGTWRSFNVTGAIPSGAQPPLTPLTGTATDAATARFPSLSWEPYPGADHYKVDVADHGSPYSYADSADPLLSTKFHYPSASSSGSTFLNPGQYDWWVSAYDANDVQLGTYGAMGTFTIIDLQSVSNARIALNGDSLRADQFCTAQAPDVCTGLPATPVLAWDPVPEAAFYKVFISQDPDITNFVYGSSSANVPTTVNTYWTPRMGNSPTTLELPDSTAGVPYYWYILPCKATGICNPDPASQSDQTAYPKQAFQKISPAPVQATPEVGTTVANDVAFAWSDYLATNQATTWGPGAQTSYQSGETYHIQVGTQEANFQDHLIDDQKVDQLTYTPYDRTYPEGNLYWRVQVIDHSGNGLAWSPIRQVFKQSPIPALSSPANDAHSGGLTPFRWSATDYAGQYRIEVYKNNDLTFSTANRIFSSTTKQTAYAWTSPLVPSDQAYLWRVQRLDAQGKPGSFSTPRTFFVDKAVPTTTSPQPSATVAANDVYFAWTAVPTARRYQVEYRKVGSTSVVMTTTSALSYSPTATLTVGTYVWSVHSLDANDKDMGASVESTFVVSAPVVVTPPPSGSGGPTSGSSKPPAGATGGGFAIGAPSSAVPVASAPKIVRVTPRIGLSVKRTGPITVVFSEPVAGVNSKTVRITYKGKKVSLKVTYRASTRTLVIKPKKRLTKGRTYKVAISSGIKDVTGTHFPASSWKFKAK